MSFNLSNIHFHIMHNIKQNILVTVDNVIFTIINEKLQVLLVSRPIEPFKDFWTLPGWFVVENETLEEAAYKKLEEKTSVKNIYLEQLYTFSDVNRDPRWRVLSTAYMALVAKENLLLKSWKHILSPYWWSFR